MQQYPKTSLITGATTVYIYPKGEKSETSRKNREGFYYDYFNTALQINARDSLQKYHKSKLVIGVEMMPYPTFFRLFENFIISLGGTSGTLGTQKERSVFKNSQNKACIAPAVCYESIYGEFMTEFIKKGANVIFVITNDAWWGDTPGYKQHLSYSKLRAIENRRSIVRCANTGISAIINQKGEIEKQTEYWKEDVLNGSINLNEKISFYSENGDFIGRIALFISYFWVLGFMLNTIYKIVKNHKTKLKI
jgi:apolipoprotein N-acyltransferase